MISFKKLVNEFILLHQSITFNTQPRYSVICSIVILFFIASITELAFSNNFALEAYPVEVTGKVLIEPPLCQDNEEYDAISDTCKQISSQGNGTDDPSSDPSGPPPSPNPPEETVVPPRPSILTANASDVETKAGGEIIPFQQIVIVNSTSKNVQSLNSTIQALTDIVENLGAEVIYSYNSTITGFTFKAPNQQVTDEIVGALSLDQRVKFVEQDRTVVPFSDQIPTGLQRIDANGLYSIPNIGSFSADVDIAIIDSGIDLDNPDLNVYSNTSMMIPQESEPNVDDSYSIVNNNVNLDRLGLDNSAVGGNTTSFDPPFTANLLTSGDDTCGHGTHVAGIAAAKADSRGVVGIAPDARLWAIKALDYDKFRGTCEGSISSTIAAIEYITRLKDKIEIVNLSLGCKCNSTALDDAISKAVRANITIVVAAGNINSDASKFSPANHKDVVAVSAITDLDGKCGGLNKPKWINAGQFSGLYDDDSFSRFSNYGEAVDIAAPGVMINSTDMNGSYSLSNGTSMAAPYVTGAAALYKILNPGSTPSDIRNALVKDGIQSSVVCDGDRHGYFVKDPDRISEPLLYVDDLVKKIKEKFDNVSPHEDIKS
jgi:subtilisin family serine protease